MDWFLIKSVNPEYPLSHHECAEKCTLFFKGLSHLLKCVTPPENGTIIYSPGICLPNTNEIYGRHVTPSLRKNWFSEGTQFWQITWMILESSKIDYISKLTKQGPRRCHKVSCVQIWQKNSNGKCPKLPERNSHALYYKGGLSVSCNH